MQHNDVLNEVLVVTGRSLLQYTAQAWPWNRGNSDQLRAALAQLVAEQRSRIQKLADVLDGRRWAIDFGNWPDYTDLHYVAIDFILPNLIRNQRSVVNEIEAALPRCAGDAEGSALLSEILQGERAALARLEEFSRTPTKEHAT